VDSRLRVLPADSEPFPMTEGGNARRYAALARAQGGSLFYCEDLGVWFSWDGKRWKRDHGIATQEMAKRVVRSVRQETVNEKLTPVAYQELAKHAIRSDSAKSIRSTIELAGSEPGMHVEHHRLDAQPMLLNIENGTLELTTGQLRPHDRADLLTKLCSVKYDPKAKCPTWLRFLDEIMAGRADLVDYLRRLSGYFLTGVIREHVLPVFYGVGRNGKTTFIDALLDLLGDYAGPAPKDLLMRKRNEQHPTEIADLDGLRLAVASETQRGQRLDESLVKLLTGGDPLKARHMRQDFYKFDPTHKLVLLTNHKPVVKDTTESIWSRLPLVPFGVVVPPQKRDLQLREKLRAEMPGILNWCIAGCLEWQRAGLNPPTAVLEASHEYRSEEDTIGQFLAECCVFGADFWAASGAMTEALGKWLEAQGEPKVAARDLRDALRERGCRRQQETSGARRKGWIGVGLRRPDDPDRYPDRDSRGTDERHEPDFQYRYAEDRLGRQTGNCGSSGSTGSNHRGNEQNQRLLATAEDLRPGEDDPSTSLKADAIERKGTADRAVHPQPAPPGKDEGPCGDAALDAGQSGRGANSHGAKSPGRGQSELAVVLEQACHPHLDGTAIDLFLELQRWGLPQEYSTPEGLLAVLLELGWASPLGDGRYRLTAPADEARF
jgi:P4 family phage/plasmid primase-like protien